MKKVVILVIALIYLASVFVVNFFGLEVVIFDGTTYVKDIAVNQVTVYDLSGDGKDQVAVKGQEYLTISKQKYDLYTFEFTPAPEGKEYTAENIAENPNSVFLDIGVFPKDADHKGVEFIYDKEATEGNVIFLEEKKTIVFLKPFTASLSLRAVDGSNVQTTKFYIQMQEKKG